MTPERAAQLRAERRAFLNAFKAAIGCKDCGTFDGRLDFDHRDKSTKSFKIGSNVQLGWAKLRAEIKKCDVRCASCHAKRHFQDDPTFLARHRHGKGQSVPEPLTLLEGTWRG